MTMIAGSIFLFTLLFSLIQSNINWGKQKQMQEKTKEKMDEAIALEN